MADEYSSVHQQVVNFCVALDFTRLFSILNL